MSLTQWKSPPAGLDLTNFHYTRLKSKNAIRLLHLVPGSGNKGIAITLVDSFLCNPGQSSSYDALSYTWGDGQPDKPITCDGRRLMVTQTLLEALRYFRDPDRPVVLWVDQICICQDRVSEKNQQVQMMGKIFKTARKVIVWLGNHYDDSRAGMQLAVQLLDISARHRFLSPDQLEAHGLPKRGTRRWTSLAAILRRPWFYRTWIVQEVVFNPQVEVVLGDCSLSWDDLEKIVDLVEGPVTRRWQLDATMNAWELPFSRINRIRQWHHRHLPQQPHQSVKGGVPTCEVDNPCHRNEGSIDLLDLLVMARGLGATDPRDKVYALLGLSTSDVAPDYSISPAMIFIDFAMQILGKVTQSGNRVASCTKEARQVMLLLACAGGGSRLPEQEHLGDSNDAPDLPSWVPDWTTFLLSRPFVFDPRFQAGGETLEVDWDHESGLRLWGKLIDTVEAAGTVLLDHAPEDAASKSHSKIEKWWRESQSIACARTVRSPGSTMNVDAFKGLCRDLGICEHGYFTGEHSHATENNTAKSHPKRRSSLLDETEISPDPLHSAQHTLAFGPSTGRVLFVTTTGFVGLAPHSVRGGDLVYIILGANIPFVLRPRPNNVDFELVGEAYVQGIMQGEAVEMNHWTGFEDVCIQ